MIKLFSSNFQMLSSVPWQLLHDSYEANKWPPLLFRVVRMFACASCLRDKTHNVILKSAKWWDHGLQQLSGFDSIELFIGVVRSQLSTFKVLDEELELRQLLIILMKEMRACWPIIHLWQNIQISYSGVARKFFLGSEFRGFGGAWRLYDEKCWPISAS